MSTSETINLKTAETFLNMLDPEGNFTFFAKGEGVASTKIAATTLHGALLNKSEIGCHPAELA